MVYCCVFLVPRWVYDVWWEAHRRIDNENGSTFFQFLTCGDTSVLGWQFPWDVVVVSHVCPPNLFGFFEEPVSPISAPNPSHGYIIIL